MITETVVYEVNSFCISFSGFTIKLFYLFEKHLIRTEGSKLLTYFNDNEEKFLFSFLPTF